MGAVGTTMQLSQHVKIHIAARSLSRLLTDWDAAACRLSPGVGAGAHVRGCPCTSCLVVGCAFGRALLVEGCDWAGKGCIANFGGLDGAHCNMEKGQHGSSTSESARRRGCTTVPFQGWHCQQRQYARPASFPGCIANFAGLDGDTATCRSSTAYNTGAQ